VVAQTGLCLCKNFAEGGTEGDDWELISDIRHAACGANPFAHDNAMLASDPASHFDPASACNFAICSEI
jgi:hypothetical protein